MRIGKYQLDLYCNLLAWSFPLSLEKFENLLYIGFLCFELEIEKLGEVKL